MAVTKNVGDVMTREVLTLRSDQTLLDAMLFVREHHVRHILVVDDGALKGVVSDRDLKRATPSTLLTTDQAAWRKTLESTPLAVIMTSNPITVGPDAPLKASLGLLIEQKFGCLPVVEKGELVGIVTAIDLMRAAFDALD